MQNRILEELVFFLAVLAFCGKLLCPLMSVSPTAESQLKRSGLFVCIWMCAKSYMKEVCCNIVNWHDKVLLI